MSWRLGCWFVWLGIGLEGSKIGSDTRANDSILWKDTCSTWIGGSGILQLSASE
ncbi:hypothetical protein Tco_0637992, partial [Tanacetum coccineum]